MINQNEYAWEDIQIVLPGKPLPIEGVVAVEYTEKKEHMNIYGRGSKPIRMGRGKTEYEGSITLLQSEIEALQQSLPAGKSLTQMVPFTITVAYAPEGGVSVVDQLLFCRIKEVKKGIKQGDGNMEVALSLAIGDIKYNV